MPSDDHVDIHWYNVRCSYDRRGDWTFHDHDALHAPWALYAFFDPHHDDGLHYFGKASGRALDRLMADDKDGLYDFLVENGIRPRLRIGIPALAAGKRWSHELLSDVEALLIYRLRKDIAWNQQNMRSRGSYYRRGLTIEMHGAWLHSRMSFRDDYR